MLNQRWDSPLQLPTRGTRDPVQYADVGRSDSNQDACVLQEAPENQGINMIEQMNRN